MLNTDKELKLYYSIGEVADMFGVNPSLLRFWEKEFPQISPKTAGRGIRQYRKEALSFCKSMLRACALAIFTLFRFSKSGKEKPTTTPLKGTPVSVFRR